MASEPRTGNAVYDAICALSERRARGTGLRWLRVGSLFLIPSTFSGWQGDTYVILNVRFGLAFPDIEVNSPEQLVVDFAEVESEDGAELVLDYKVTQYLNRLVVTSPRGVAGGSNGRKIIDMDEQLMLARGGLRYVLKTIADHATRVRAAVEKRVKMSRAVQAGWRTKTPCVPLSRKETRSNERLGVQRHPHNTRW